MYLLHIVGVKWLLFDLLQFPQDQFQNHELVLKKCKGWCFGHACLTLMLLCVGLHFILSSTFHNINKNVKALKTKSIYKTAVSTRPLFSMVYLVKSLLLTVFISSQYVQSRFLSHQIQIEQRDPPMKSKQILVSQEKTPPQDYRNLNLPFGFDLEPKITAKKPQSENTSERNQSRTQKYSFSQIHKDLMKLLKKAQKFERLMKMAMRLKSDMEESRYVRLH